MRRMPNEIVTPRSAARVTGMVRVAPDPAVVDLVEHHWIVTWNRRGKPPARREILPDPCVNLAVEPGGRLVYGVGSGRGIRELEDEGMVVGTKFRPGGFSGFLPGPVSDLTGRVLTLPDAFGVAGEQLDAALLDASDIASMIAEVTRFLAVNRPAPDRQRQLAMDIAEAMRGAAPGTGVSELARDFAVSPRTMQRLFVRHIGTTPKQVLQRFRRQRAVDRLSEPGAPSLAWIAAELGYADQSHLTRDFRATLGRGPAVVRSATR